MCTTFSLVYIYPRYGKIYQLHIQSRRATDFGGRMDFIAGLLDLSYFIYAFYPNLKLALLSIKILICETHSIFRLKPLTTS